MQLNNSMQLIQQSPEFLSTLHLYGHVDKCLREELHKKVHNVETEAVICKMLWTVLEETYPNRLHNHLKMSLNCLSSVPQAAVFLSYFRSEWCNKTNQSTYCYCLRSGINSNMYSENLHKNFKRYLNGKRNKRVNVCMIKCVEFLCDQIFKRIIS